MKNKIITGLPEVQEANRKLTQLRGLAEDELSMGKSSEVVGWQTATSSLASDNDVKSEAAASDMTSCSLGKKKWLWEKHQKSSEIGRRSVKEEIGRRTGMSPYISNQFFILSSICVALSRAQAYHWLYPMHPSLCAPGLTMMIAEKSSTKNWRISSVTT